MNPARLFRIPWIRAGICGLGGGALAHVTCILAFIIPALSGLGGVFLFGPSVYLLGLVIALSVWAGMMIYRGVYPSWPAVLLSIALIMVMSAVPIILLHRHDLREARMWYNAQSAPIQKSITLTAQNLGVPLDDYILTICSKRKPDWQRFPLSIIIPW